MRNIGPRKPPTFNVIEGSRFASYNGPIDTDIILPAGARLVPAGSNGDFTVEPRSAAAQAAKRPRGIIGKFLIRNDIPFAWTSTGFVVRPKNSGQAALIRLRLF